MSNEIQVVIQEGGTTAITVNPYKDMSTFEKDHEYRAPFIGDILLYEKWQKAQAARKVYKVVLMFGNEMFDLEEIRMRQILPKIFDVEKFAPGTQHRAVVLDEEKRICKII